MGFYNYNDNAQAQPVSLDLNAVMRQVYAWMTLGLLATAGTAFWLASSGAAIKIFSSTPIMLITIVGYLILGFTLQPIVTRSQPVVGIIAYLALTILMGIMLSSIFLTYRLGTIGFAFLATAGAFGAMSIIGYTTKVELAKFGSILMMALIGLIIATIINMFFASDALYWIINYAGVVIFSGLTAYDTQRIKNNATSMAGTGDLNAVTRVAIIGAFHLYLDFVNLFLFLLRILSGGRRR